MLSEPTKRSPRDNLQNHLKACQKPLKSYRLKVMFLVVNFIVIVFHFFSQALKELEEDMNYLKRKGGETV